jgi:hypothetical protein
MKLVYFVCAILGHQVLAASIAPPTVSGVSPSSAPPLVATLPPPPAVFVNVTSPFNITIEDCFNGRTEDKILDLQSVTIVSKNFSLDSPVDISISYQSKFSLLWFHRISTRYLTDFNIQQMRLPFLPMICTASCSM